MDIRTQLASPKFTASLAENLVVILIAPNNDRTIGAVARVMRNLGVCQLCLVAPREYNPAEARVTACWAEEILDQAVVAPDLATATEGFDFIVGVAPQEENDNNSQCVARISTTELSAHLKSGKKIGLLFGPEETGLLEEHQKYCNGILPLPCGGSLLNLGVAQAVLLALFELRRVAEPYRQRSFREPRAGNTQLASLDRVVSDLVVLSADETPAQPNHSAADIRSLFQRTAPSNRELGMLLAFLGKVRRVIGARKTEPSL